jgi:hypothetical protein
MPAIPFYAGLVVAVSCEWAAVALAAEPEPLPMIFGHCKC